MAELKQEDSGNYLCATREDSKGGIILYEYILPVVTPGEYLAEGRGLSGVAKDIKPVIPYPASFTQIQPAPCSLPY